jgi:3-oxoacyl-[acyl-carrier protein] reductase
MVNVKGRWVLITGAARGIGYEAALFMARQGCNLVLHARSLAHLEKVIGDVRKLGVEAYGVVAEFSNPDDIIHMLDEIEKRGISVDILLNNAGIQVGYREEYVKTPVSDFTTSFLVNTIAPTLICYRFLPAMVKKGFGRIVNTTSGIQGQPSYAGYSASKAALDKLTIDLGTAVEGTDVIISLTDPGYCQTDMGGPQATCTPQSAVPGVCVGAFVDDGRSSRFFSAQEFTGMSLADAVKKAESSGA